MTDHAVVGETHNIRAIFFDYPLEVPDSPLDGVDELDVDFEFFGVDCLFVF